MSTFRKTSSESECIPAGIASIRDTSLVIAHDADLDACGREVLARCIARGVRAVFASFRACGDRSGRGERHAAWGASRTCRPRARNADHKTRTEAERVAQFELVAIDQYT